ncbi:MAG TPA: hypothetical protein VN428_02485 [Bryobacteraceae bacterium]|nr:hypothetical protein [Bryobacteraceae bacterium]
MRNCPRFTRRTFLLFCSAPVAFAAPLGAEALEIRLVSGRLKVSAPQFRFVTGKALERLHNGAPVPFAVQLSLSTTRSGVPILRDIQRFVLSYDIWEQRFAASRLGPRRRSASNLTANAVETWCLDEMSLEPSGVSEQQQFWLRVEVRAEEPRQDAPDYDEPLNLTRLIDLFSRKARGEDRRTRIEAGPFRLAELRRTFPPRGGFGGFGSLGSRAAP